MQAKRTALILAVLASLALPTAATAHGKHHHHHAAHHARHHAHHARSASTPCKWSAYFEECLTAAEEQEIEASVTEAFVQMEAEGWHEPAE